MAPKAANKPKAAKNPEDESVKKVEQPDTAAYASRVKVIQDKIDALQKKQATIQSQINEKSEGKDEYFLRKGELRAQIDQIDERMDALTAQKDDVAKVADGKKNEENSVRNQVKKMQNSMAYRSIDDIDKRIQELEMKLQVDTMSLKEEKDLLAEVKDLKKCKPKVTQLQAMESTLQKGGGAGLHKNDLNVLNEALYQCRVEKRELVAKIKELTEERQSKMGDMGGVMEEKKKIGEQIVALIAERKEIKNEEYEATREYYAYLAEERQRRNERYASERAKTQAEYEQKRRQKLADSLDEQPHLEEMTLIEQTLFWCNGRIESKTEEVKVEKAEIKHDIPEGGALLVSKKAREDEYYFEPTKKGKKGKGPKKTDTSSKAIKHNAETFRYFDELKIDAPLTDANIPATIQKLNEKYAQFEAKVQTWKEQRDERKKKILEEGVDPDTVEETKDGEETKE